MKKVVVLFLTLTLLCSTALADEILFRDIPWYSNLADTLTQMPEYSDINALDWETRVTIIGEEREFDKPNNGIAPMLSFENTPFKVGGYNVGNITLNFVYSVDNGQVLRSEDDWKLIGATYHFSNIDQKTASENLIEKLSSLYGEPVRTSVDTISYITWYGDSNSLVSLNIGDQWLSLSYGISNTELMNELDEVLITEQSEAAKGNTDGL